jgi:hypothetical protein
MLKALKAIKMVVSKTKLDNLIIIKAIKLSKGALLMLLKFKDMAEWLQSQEVEHFFTT